MDNVVVDSSVIIKWLNTKDEENIAEAEKVLKDAQAGKIQLFAPEIFRYEIGNALLSKKLKQAEAFDTLGTAYDLPVTAVGEVKELAFESYKLAQTYDITYYDASFVSLAKQTNAALVTANPKHQAKVKDVKVVPLKDYK